MLHLFSRERKCFCVLDFHENLKHNERQLIQAGCLAHFSLALYHYNVGRVFLKINVERPLYCHAFAHVWRSGDIFQVFKENKIDFWVSSKCKSDSLSHLKKLHKKWWHTLSTQWPLTSPVHSGCCRLSTSLSKRKYRSHFALTSHVNNFFKVFAPIYCHDNLVLWRTTNAVKYFLNTISHVLFSLLYHSNYRCSRHGIMSFCHFPYIIITASLSHRHAQPWSVNRLQR